MSSGRILVARQDGAYCLKMLGDVRLNLCTTIDLQINEMLADPALLSVLIDLHEAENMDSTTLGLLAKIAIGCRERLGTVPTIIAGNAAIERILNSVGFDRVFDLVDELPHSEQGLAELPLVQDSEEATRERIIAAHRVLMGLNPANRAAFADLVETLERS